LSGRTAEPTVGTARWYGFRLREILRREGWRGAGFRVLAALGYRRWGWFERPLSEPVASIEARVPIRFAELERGQLPVYLAFRRGSTPEQFLGRLERGERCFGAWLADRLVSVTWVSTDFVRVGEIEWPLEPGTFYFHDTFTSRNARGLHVQGALSAHLLERYRRAGFRRAVALIVPENRPNVANRARSGFRRAGTFVSITIGPLRRAFLRGECPGHVPSAAPGIRA
jgi:hypothetical protein